MCILESYGICGPLICSIMNSRTQQTRVGKSLSAKTSLTSGVVQGSVIGLLRLVSPVVLYREVLSVC